MRTALTPVGRRIFGRPPPMGLPTSEVITRPAPIGGWNVRDSLALMPFTDAVTLDNLFPGNNKVELRKGHTSHATGVGSGDVETIAEYHSGATRTMLAAGGGSIYDATSAGAATSKASGFTSNRWQWANFNGNMGLVNGTDAPQIYNGSTVTAMTISGSGLTVTDLIGINAFQNRTYFWEDDSQDFWYSAVNALGGTLTKFPLSRVHQFGGNLISMGTWTIDAGEGIDDLASFIMSSGDVAIYRGSNPGDAAAWALVGVFKIGAPLSIRGVAKVGGDLVVMTKDGYAPLGGVLARGRIDYTGVISDKIAPAVIDAASAHASNYGWQAILYPNGKQILFNVPVSTVTFHQHVVNTVTGSWCRFKGMNGVSWGLFNDDLYFGGAGDGIVYKADNGTADDSSDISAEAETAYDYFGSSGAQKHLIALGPVIAANGSLSFGLGAQADFRGDTISNDTYSITSSIGGEDIWESITSNWDDVTLVYQSADADIFRKWISATANGDAISARFSFATQIAVSWYAMRYMMTKGGVI